MDNNIPVAKNLKMVKEFVNHNLQLNNITKETTIEELLQFIDNIEQTYVPLVLQTMELKNNLYMDEKERI